jgi:Leucine-rich repeat (LRR) protein
VPIKVLPLKKELLKLPPEIGNCTALERLELNELTLKEFPNKISKLARLKFLNISYCQFREFPTVSKYLSLSCIYTIASFLSCLQIIGKIFPKKEIMLKYWTLSNSALFLVCELPLITLFANRSGFTTIPAAISKLTNLVGTCRIFFCEISIRYDDPLRF